MVWRDGLLVLDRLTPKPHGLRRPLHVRIDDNDMGQSVSSPASRRLPESTASAPLEKQPRPPQTGSSDVLPLPLSPATQDMS